MSITIGIDPAYGSAGDKNKGCGVIALDTDTGQIIEEILIRTTNKDSEIDRVKQIWEKISALFISPVEIVAIEGVAFDKGERAHQMGYLHFRLREYLQDCDVKPLVIVPAPNQLKKFVTGSHQAKKELMLLHVYKRYGVEFSINDLADAYGLAQIARAYVGAEDKLLKPQQEVIAALKGDKVEKKSKGKVAE